MKKTVLLVASMLLASTSVFAQQTELPKFTQAQLNQFKWDGSKISDSSKPKKAKKKKRVAKHAAKKSRMPASIEPAQPETEVFNIDTSFEAMLAEKAKLERAPAAFSPMARVIGVRRELGLNDADSNKAARDIILNGGTGAGISEGMVLSVMRKIPVIDPYQANAQFELEVEFAKVKIVHAQNDIAVARLQSIESLEEGLSIGTRAILVGDFVTQGKK